jgi:hypothetical protein
VKRRNWKMHLIEQFNRAKATLGRINDWVDAPDGIDVPKLRTA